MTVILTSSVKGLAVGASYTGVDEDWLAENGYARVAGNTRDMVTATSVPIDEDPQIHETTIENPDYGDPGEPKYLYKERMGLGKPPVAVAGTNPLATDPSGSQTHASDDVLDVDADVTSISVAPATSGKAAGQTTQLVVTATYADSSTAVVTEDATYVSSVPAKATVDAAGLITFVATGPSTITATYGGKTDTCVATTS